MRKINQLKGPSGPGYSRRRALVSALYGLAGLAPALLRAGQGDAVQGPVNKGAALAELATPWVSQWDPTPFALSEKLDGVRAIWDGQTLRYRSGRVIAAPPWFTAVLPAHRLDGELWLGRGSFDRLSATVRAQPPVDEAWRAVRYMVFDAPDPALAFRQRYEKLQALVTQTQVPWLVAVQQWDVSGAADLQAHYQRWMAEGAEGVVLHRWDAPWQPGRSDAVRKLKPVEDEDGTVIAIIPGKGKFQGVMGSLLLEAPSKMRFRLGTGFSEADRKSPPAVGTSVTYRYSDHTSNGVPRFPSFLRVAAHD